MTMTLGQVRSAFNILSDMSDEEIKRRAPNFYEFTKALMDTGVQDDASKFIGAMGAIIRFCGDSRETRIQTELIALS